MDRVLDTRFAQNAHLPTVAHAASPDARTPRR